MLLGGSGLEDLRYCEVDVLLDDVESAVLGEFSFVLGGGGVSDANRDLLLEVEELEEVLLRFAVLYLAAPMSKLGKISLSLGFQS